MPVIYSVSANSGYLTGEQNLTFKGHGFNSGKISTVIDGHNCKVTDQTNEQFSCSTGAGDRVSILNGAFVGHNGLEKVMKDGTSGLATEMATTSTGVDTISGWFVPRVTGMHTFWAACEDGCTVSIAESPDTRDKLTEIIMLKEGTGRRDYFKNEGQKSQTISLE